MSHQPGKAEEHLEQILATYKDSLETACNTLILALETTDEFSDFYSKMENELQKIDQVDSFHRILFENSQYSPDLLSNLRSSTNRLTDTIYLILESEFNIEEFDSHITSIYQKSDKGFDEYTLNDYLSYVENDLLKPGQDPFYGVLMSFPFHTINETSIDFNGLRKDIIRRSHNQVNIQMGEILIRDILKILLQYNFDFLKKIQSIWESVEEIYVEYARNRGLLKDSFQDFIPDGGTSIDPSVWGSASLCTLGVITIPAGVLLGDPGIFITGVAASLAGIQGWPYKYDIEYEYNIEIKKESK